MKIKTILVPMNAVQSDRSTLDLALSVARRSGAHIKALFVRQDPRDAMSFAGLGAEGIAVGRIMDDIEREGGAASDRAFKAFESWCAKNDLSEAKAPALSDKPTAEWRGDMGAPDAVIARQGGLADLIVETGLHDSKLPLEQSTIEASLFGSGKPVLVTPPKLPNDVFDTALIAWNGSREANRAVGAALELLGLCRRVLVFCQAEPQRVARDPAELVEALAWHGITAKPVAAAAPANHVGTELLAVAQRESASLLVSGAYTHGRFRQMVLGGLTNDILHHAEIPALLIH
jgi:nucleotide-binding universal stress UspA family protein